MQNFLFLVLQNSISQSELVGHRRWTSGKCQTSWHNSKIDHLAVHTRHNQVNLLLNCLVLKYECILSCFYHDSWSVGISFKIFLTFRTVFFTLCNTTTLDCVTCLLWVVIFHTLLVPLGLKSVKPINTFFKHDRFGKRQKILPLQIHKSVKWSKVWNFTLSIFQSRSDSRVSVVCLFVSSSVTLFKASK